MASRSLFRALPTRSRRQIVGSLRQTPLRQFSVAAPWRQEVRPEEANTPSSTSDPVNAVNEEGLIPPSDALKVPIWVQKANAAPDVTPSNLSINRLLAVGLHLGHSTSLWEPATLPFIFGTREGISIINLEHTLVYLRRACNVARQVALRGGTILFVGTRPGFANLTIEAAQRCENYHVSGKWIPGTLTNAQQVLGRHAPPNPDDPNRPPKTYKPDLLVVLNPLENRIALSEAQLNMIPTIAITDTDFDPRKVTYPIPANDDSIPGVKLIADVISMAAQEGNLRRKTLLAQKEKQEFLKRKNQMFSRFQEPEE